MLTNGLKTDITAHGKYKCTKWPGTVRNYGGKIHAAHDERSVALTKSR
jgi:hypothetical protein